MDIFVPPSLKQADDFLNALKNFLDPQTRKKIEEDIVRFHTLNDGEAKKYADATAFIKQHSDVLTETQRLNADTEAKEKKLAKDRISFKVEMEAENEKLSHEREAIKTEMEKVNRLNAQIIEARDSISNRESALNNEKELHESNVRKLADDRKTLEKQKSDIDDAFEKKKSEIDEYKQRVVNMDNETREKLEKLKQFKF